ncbi:hypothetical protein GUJ93_ZPchr0002g24447 [Zizania palustris]|uniref:Uncharacterized protein n=1 Tax=Zizania palustris TaxID=103762 RepID=A0A8J5VEB2_ZIZPA|nr:hypothetical protein GUJ93_ZPchr0002g24447 [Zizania palustris]
MEIEMEREIRINVKLNFMLKKMEESKGLEQKNIANLRAMRLAIEFRLLKMKKMADPDQEGEKDSPLSSLAMSPAPLLPPLLALLAPSVNVSRFLGQPHHEEEPSEIWLTKVDDDDADYASGGSECDDK